MPRKSPVRTRRRTPGEKHTSAPKTVQVGIPAMVVGRVSPEADAAIKRGLALERQEREAAASRKKHSRATVPPPGSRMR